MNFLVMVCKKHSCIKKPRAFGSFMRQTICKAVSSFVDKMGNVAPYKDELKGKFRRLQF